jgi:hypothetical protein
MTPVACGCAGETMGVKSQEMERPPRLFPDLEAALAYLGIRARWRGRCGRGPRERA